MKTSPVLNPSLSLLFDLDGTLADTAPDLCATLNVVLTAAGRGTVLESKVRHLIGGGALVLLERGLRETGGPVSGPEMKRLYDHFLGHYEEHIADHSTLWPGLKEQLDVLADAGVKLAVCTNKIERLTFRALDGLGLSPYFPVVIAGDTLPVKKPHPEHLLEAVRRLGGSPSSTIMVGDSEADVDAAIAANMPSICVTFGYPGRPLDEINATKFIDHFDDFPAAIQHIIQR